MDRQRMADEILMERAIDDVLMREASKRIKEIVDAATASREAWQVASAPFTDNPICPHFWKNTGFGSWECMWCPETRDTLFSPDKY